MKKTVDINLGGISFQIDEDAFKDLVNYFDSIEQYLSHSNGKDEIMNDIELRISELLLEKLKRERQVVTSKNIDEIIRIMGKPEDYKPDGDTTIHDLNNTNKKRIKKLYRDKEHALIGGVAGGLGHYLGINPIKIRIILVFLVLIGFGSGILVYLIAWFIIPPALSTTEKLEMKGEPITISNIEKKIKEEFENVSHKIKNDSRTGITKILLFIKEFIVRILKIFSTFIGILFIITIIVLFILSVFFLHY